MNKFKNYLSYPLTLKDFGIFITMTEKEQILNILNLLIKPRFPEIIEFKIKEKPIFDRFGENPVHQLIVVVDGTDYEQEKEIDEEILSVLRYINLQNKVMVRHITT
jgi:hypothetical protein